LPSDEKAGNRPPGEIHTPFGCPVEEEIRQRVFVYYETLSLNLTYLYARVYVQYETMKAQFPYLRKRLKYIALVGCSIGHITKRGNIEI
jgi:hypothetical protein